MGLGRFLAMKTHVTVLVFAMCVPVFFCFPAGGQEAPVQITEGEHRDMDPMISPDGKSLAFASNRTGNFDIWVYNYGSQAFVQVTRSEKDDRYPNWSPDGKKVLFTSDRTGNGDIYETSVDSPAGNLQLTVSENLEEYASYHPNTGEMLFARAERRRLLRRKMTIVLAEGPGSTTRVLVDDGDEPRFSPDGKQLIFVSRRTKNKDIWLTDAAGGALMQLTTSSKDDENPCFSPDGKHIIFASKRTGNFDLWVMDTEGRNLRQLTTDPADEKQPCWSSDGAIYYTRDMSTTVSNIWRLKAPE
jgi:Tol biopolymer transport system component